MFFYSLDALYPGPITARRARTGHCAMLCDNAAMSEPRSTPPPQPRPLSPLKIAPTDDQMLCERCGAEMYRMHAVWRCTECGFKTDCCGW
jgi:hypothetical protein